MTQTMLKEISEKNCGSLLFPTHLLSIYCPMPSHKFPRHVENLIANFRGLPEDRSRSRLNETTPFQDVIEKVIQKYRIGMASPEETLREHWAEIVGAANVQFCHPTRIERGKNLIITVSNPVVRQELFFNRKLLIKKIQEIPNCRDITLGNLRVG